MFHQVTWIQGVGISSFRRTDSFEEFLKECFNVPVSNSRSLLDFDLSLLPLPSESVLTPGASSEVAAEAFDCLRDSVQLRNSDLEERFGMYQFAFFRVKSLVLKRMILASRAVLRTCGFHVNLVLVRDRVCANMLLLFFLCSFWSD